MEQQEQRRKYMKAIPEFCKKFELTQIFMKELEQHSMSEYIPTVMQLKDKETQKNFILLEFTKERSTCNELIEILRRSGQIEAAKLLQIYNTSPKFMNLSNDIELEVTPSQSLKSYSRMFVMEGKPRGKCIIINNIKYLEKESKRFEYVFKQLLFNVELFDNKTAKEIEIRLNELAKDETLETDHALIVMIISHGHDENIVGIDGNDLPIEAIVNIFSEKNCKALAKKPKMFFFNCCRSKTSGVKLTVKDNKIVIDGLPSLQHWVNKNKYTLICFACAEGTESEHGDITLFGQAFSHCIAQYACDKSLLSILTLTSDRMEQIRIEKEEEGFIGLQDSPEIRLCKVTRDIYFNPGLYKENKVVLRYSEKPL